jgi:hypothetical protein
MSLEKWSIEEGWILCKMDGLQCAITCPQFKRGTTAFPITTIGLITDLRRKQSPPGREWVGAYWASRGPSASGGPTRRLRRAATPIRQLVGFLYGGSTTRAARWPAQCRRAADLSGASGARRARGFDACQRLPVSLPLRSRSTPDSRSHSILRCPCLY